MTRRAALAALLLFLASAGLVHAAEFRPFHSGSLAEVLAARAKKPFLMVLWSVTCAPCRQEFELLGQIRKSHPRMALVLICTDGIADRAMAAKIVSRYGLDGAESWIFADSNAAKLRYEIDPGWYGEMPRAYFYDAVHHREGVSGSLDRARVEAWLARIKA